MARARSTPTIHDVASAAGVSVTTVSRVLNAKGDVSAETAARVRTVIESLSYESSMAARSMRGGRTQVIGLLMPDMDHSYAMEVIRAASRVITGTAYDLIAMTCGSKNHADRGRWEQQRVRGLNGSITDGVIVVVPDAAELRTDYPLVAIDPLAEASNYPSVSGDNLGGGQAVMAYLLELGHTRIGYVDGFEYLESATQRRAAYVSALKAAGLPFDPALVQPGDFTRAAGAAALHRFVALPEPPTAIFACNDDTAFGILEAARTLGIDVPNALSVIGFDNVPEAAFVRPALTTVDQGIEQLVQTAMQMLLELIAGRPLPVDRVKVSTRLMVRDSCAPPAGSKHRRTTARPSQAAQSARQQQSALVQP